MVWVSIHGYCVFFVFFKQLRADRNENSINLSYFVIKNV